ncbi:MAG: hypothetical protein PHW53_05210 [Patescibacteria group bacterium]|nr:hypothetical protein [Patescibacteria group bacterium]
MNEMIEILEEEKLRLMDLRRMLLKHSESGAHHRLAYVTDAINQAIDDIIRVSQQ